METNEFLPPRWRFPRSIVISRHSMSVPPHTTMNQCPACQQETPLLFEIFDTSCHSITTEEGVEPKTLCGTCIVGKRVPVFRAAQGWRLGDVLNQQNDNQHQVTFGEGDVETVTVSRTPFGDYVRHFRKESPTKNSAKFQAWLLHNFNYPRVCGIDDGSHASAYSDIFDPSQWTLQCVSRNSMISPLRAPTPPPMDMPFVQTTMYGPKQPPHSPKAKDTPSRKSIPRTWTPEEDQLLVRVVEKESRPTKWSEVAMSISERTGKQCRERYLNHLKPKLRLEEWTPPEDVLLCSLYQAIGSKWSLMTKCIRGRTDNNIKNRFHHIRRRLEKDISRFRATRDIGEIASMIHLDEMNTDPIRAEENSEFAIKVRQILPYVAADSVKEDGETSYFESFNKADGHVRCTRCSLFVPSKQAGEVICKTTGWCEPCTKIPPYVVGDMLRHCLRLRKGKETDHASVEKTLEGYL